MNFDYLKKILDDWGSLLSLILTPFLAWFFSRDRQKVENKKLSTETDSIVVQSTEKLVKQWENFYNDVKKDYKELQTVNSSLQRINEEYVNKIPLLLNKVAEMDLKISKLDTYTKNLQNYTQELEMYTFEIKEAIEILILEIEKNNPDFAIEKREKIKQALRKLENAKKPQAIIN